MDTHNNDILIIGAGMAGLTCATRLAAAGYSVTVLDKGRGPGGRMAARRAEIAGETVSFDHGAQYFTARDPGFQEVVSKWEETGAVARWTAAGGDAWVGTPGMNGPIRAMAEPLDVQWGTRAEGIACEGTRWKVKAGERVFAASTVLVAIPAEQTRELLSATAPQFAAIAGGVTSEPCWAVMAAFDRPLLIAKDAMRDPEAAIAWAARNSAKPGRKDTEAWVLHASPKRSREVLDVPKEEAAALLLADFFDQTGIDPVGPLHCVAHRWLYAMPERVAGEPARYDAEARIGIAGDYLHSPRVEGAFVSGRALAAQVLAHP
ncbi:FAD-dependent oxidoreductase [uncultured Erythrobacter sp.]|uniref:NAD(P)/FAD-dependent oxidoreductase n=1 Tax=uncultured Erythrobacter sp. TaxID=263913 RepID=UPI0026198B00|nr:FAD-dependent oxidoreductase [uncultured Erythrobacter sp.]